MNVAWIKDSLKIVTKIPGLGENPIVFINFILLIFLPEWQKRLDWFGKMLGGRKQKGGMI